MTTGNPGKTTRRELSRWLAPLVMILFIVVTLTGQAAAFAPKPPPPALAKYEPPDGKVLAIIGQDLIEFDEYCRHIVDDNPDLLPGGTTLYAFLDYYDRFESESIDTLMQNPSYDDVALHLSLSINGKNQEIADGDYDGALIGLADAIGRLDRPVFLRIGYEFDNRGHGNPDPEIFKRAWQRIVDKVRGRGVDNFATVYASTFQVELPLFFPIFEDYYPGDNYVDWVGFSFWGGPLTKFEGGMLDFARDHRKPVMIAESTPMTARFENDLLTALWWPLFFERYFSLIEENSDVIKAFHYINHDWSRNNDLWRSKLIYRVFVDMDTRIQENDYIRQHWINEMKKAKYLHASDDLFQSLSY